MGSSDKKPKLDQLVDEHLPEMLRFAVRLTGDIESAEELVQEALVRVARSWTTFRGESRFKTWLFRIVINVFRDRLAKSRPEQSLLDDPPDSRNAGPVSSVEAEELSQLIAAAVSALPPRQREVLVLAAFEGLSTPEVASVLNITEANVHSTLHAARQKLRQDLAAYLVEK